MPHSLRSALFHYALFCFAPLHYAPLRTIPLGGSFASEKVAMYYHEITCVDMTRFSVAYFTLENVDIKKVAMSPKKVTGAPKKVAGAPKKAAGASKKLAGAPKKGDRCPKNGGLHWTIPIVMVSRPLPKPQPFLSFIHSKDT